MKINILMSDLSFATAVGLGLCFAVIVLGMLIIKNYYDKNKL